MASEAGLARREPGSRVGRYGHQPLYWLLRQRGLSQTSLGSVIGRSPTYIHGVLNGSWAPDEAFVTAASDFLALPKEALFTEALLQASRLRDQPPMASDAQARRARIGRFGRQPAYWVLRERRVRRVELVSLTRRSMGHVSEVLNGSAVPEPSFVDAVAEYLQLAPAELFSNDLLDASRLRITGLSGPSPSQHVGPYGRQPAYWRLRERGVRQSDVGAMLGRSSGQISKVLNGFSLPDQRFVQVVSEVVKLAPQVLFADDVLDAFM